MKIAFFYKVINIDLTYTYFRKVKIATKKEFEKVLCNTLEQKVAR